MTSRNSNEARSATAMILPSIELHLDLVLELEEIWPDGPPEKITAQAVKEALESCGGKISTLRDWNLLDDLEVRVTAEHPDWAKGEPLFGERPPRFETVEVWDR